MCKKYEIRIMVLLLLSSLPKLYIAGLKKLELRAMCVELKELSKTCLCHCPAQNTATYLANVSWGSLIGSLHALQHGRR